MCGEGCAGQCQNSSGTPVLGLIFLKFADINYRGHEEAIQAEYERLNGTRRERPLHEIAVAQCGFYLPDHARYSYLLKLPEDQNIAKGTVKLSRPLYSSDSNRRRLSVLSGC